MFTRSDFLSYSGMLFTCDGITVSNCLKQLINRKRCIKVETIMQLVFFFYIEKITKFAIKENIGLTAKFQSS